MGGTQFIFYMVELAWFLVVFLQFRKSRRRRAKSWANGMARFFENDFHEFNLFLLQSDRSQLTSVFCNRRGDVKTTLQMTRFRDAKVYNNLATDEIDDRRIQSGYNMNCNILEIRCILHAVVNSLCGLGSCLSCGTCTALVCCTDTLRIQAIRLKSWILDLRLSGKQIICFCHDVIHDRASGVLRVVWVRAQLWTPVQTSRKNSTLVLRMRGEDSQQRWQRDHQDPEHLPHKAHEHWHVKWMCAQFSSLFCQSGSCRHNCTSHRDSSFICARHLMVITWWA